MGSSGKATTGARKAARIRLVIEEVMVRRARGEAVSDQEAIRHHADLMPELRKELEVLSLLERARTSSTGRAVPSLRHEASSTRFPGYSIVREVRRGGQGTVFEAVQTATGRRVAIKVMHQFGSGQDTTRFHREVRILGQLDHPGIVGILSSGESEGSLFYVMDFVDGVPLDQHCQAIERRIDEVMRLFERVADAVNAAHLRGIIHRDLKPGNILVDRGGQPRILDFGLARVTEESDINATRTGNFVGSMPWASPEQARGKRSLMDLRTDVYSIGVMMYEALTGQLPYAVDVGPRETLENILNAAPGRISAATIDSAARAITLKCLSKEPDRRYQSAGELAADIRRYLAGHPVLAHPPSRWYHARTMIRRNKPLFFGAVAVFVTLVLGIIGTSTGLFMAARATRSAIAERDAAVDTAYVAAIAAADSAVRVSDSPTAKKQLLSVPEALRGWEWKYLAGRADGSIGPSPFPPAFDGRTTPDGHAALMILRDGSVSLRDLRASRILWTAKLPKEAAAEHENIVAGFSRDGTLAVTQHGSRFIVWRLEDGAAAHELPERLGTWGLASASFTPDNRRLVLCGRFAKLEVWDLQQGRLERELPLTVPYSPSADVSPDGRAIAVSDERGVRVLDIETLGDVGLLPVARPSHLDWTCVRYTRDATRIVAGRGPFIVSLDPRGIQPAIFFDGGPQDIMRFDLSPDGERLIAGSWDATVRVWNVRTGVLEQTLVGHDAQVISACFNGDGSMAYSVSATGDSRAWDVSARWQRGVLENTSGREVEYDAASRRIFLHGYGALRVFDLTTETEVPLPLPERFSARGVGIAPDGAAFVYSPSVTELAMWDLRRRADRWRTEVSGGAITLARVSPDGQLVASTHTGNQVQVRRAADGALIRTITDTAGESARAVFDSQSRRIACIGSGSTILVDLRSGEARQLEFPPDRGSPAVNDLAFSPDDSLLAAADNDGGVVLWDTSTGKVARYIAVANRANFSIAFSPDGARMALGSHDRAVRIVRTSDGREMLSLRGHTAAVISLRWTSEGQLISVSADSAVRVWNNGQASW